MWSCELQFSSIELRKCYWVTPKPNWHEEKCYVRFCAFSYSKNEFNVHLKSARTSKGFLGKMIRESSFRKTSKEFHRKMVRIFFPSDIERFSSKNGKHLLSSLVTVSINREIVYVLIISLRKNKETSHALFAVHANRNLSKLQTAFKYTWILKNLWL